MKYAILTLLMLFASVMYGCSSGDTPCGGDGQRRCFFGCREGHTPENGRCGACGHRDQRCCDNRSQCRPGLSCDEGVCTGPEPVPIDPDTDCLGRFLWNVVISDPAGCAEVYQVVGDSYDEASQCLGLAAGWRAEPEGTRYRLVDLCQHCVGDLYLPVAVTTLSEDDAVMCARSSLGNGCSYTLGECPEEPPEPAEPAEP